MPSRFTRVENTGHDKWPPLHPILLLIRQHPTIPLQQIPPPPQLPPIDLQLLQNHVTFLLETLDEMAFSVQEGIPNQAQQDQILNLIHQQDITLWKMQKIINQYQQWQAYAPHHPTFRNTPPQINSLTWLLPQQPVASAEPPMSEQMQQQVINNDITNSPPTSP